MKIIKQLKFLIAGLTVAFIMLAPAPIYAELGASSPTATTSAGDPLTAAGAVCKGANNVAGTSGGCDTTSGNGVNKTIAAVINIMSWLLGVIVVIMVMIGGFKYVTSQGDAAKIKSAKSTLLYALIGAAITVMSNVIIRYVLSTVK